MKSPFKHKYQVVEEVSFADSSYTLMLVQAVTKKVRTSDPACVMMACIFAVTPCFIPVTIYVGQKEKCNRVIQQLLELPSPLQREFASSMDVDLTKTEFVAKRLMHVALTLHKKHPGMGYDQIAAEWNEKKGI